MILEETPRFVCLGAAVIRGRLIYWGVVKLNTNKTDNHLGWPKQTEKEKQKSYAITTSTKIHTLVEFCCDVIT